MSACGLSGLSFVQDRRVHIVTPANRAAVTMPVTVTWTARDFAGTYAVFVDRTPQAPGRTLASLVDHEPGCRKADGCPDVAYLAARDIHTTTTGAFTVEHVRPVGNKHSHPLHEVTIVLLDAGGRRIGESAFRVEFRVTGAD